MDMQTYKLKVIFLTPLLGSQPSADVATEFIAKRAGIDLPEDEAETLPEALERGTTVFHRLNGHFILYDYHIKGFLKEAGRVLNGQVTGEVKNLRSRVDQSIFISPRQILLHIPEGRSLDYLERPLRCETARGPRVALARSEMLPEGTWFECGITVYPGPITQSVLIDLLDYGFHKGIGQWRNGGYGTFRYELTPE